MRIKETSFRSSALVVLQLLNTRSNLVINRRRIRRCINVLRVRLKLDVEIFLLRMPYFMRTVKSYNVFTFQVN